MWTFKTKATDTQNVLTFNLEEDGKPISHHRFLTLLSSNSAFAAWYNQQLAQCGLEAFFWENKPVTTQNLQEAYECSLVQSDTLAGVSPDRQTFSSYFRDDRSVVSFENLGGDAKLIAPCPVSSNIGYPHLGRFIRKAPQDQILSLWKVTGKEMLQQVGEQPKWLSTSGLGVYWLHMRIDTTPKYYQTEAYRTL